MRIDQPEHYYIAAIERMNQAWEIYRGGAGYALAMYVAGLAVECMLRAHKMRKDTTFDERHDLKRLFQASGMLDADPAILQEKGLSEAGARRHFRELQASMVDVYDLWTNDYRFASETRLRAHLKFRKLDRGIKGDFVKARARKLLESAQRLIDKGIFQWQS
jgi:hypothetical protein